MQDATPTQHFERRTTQAGLHAQAANHHYEEVKALVELETGKFRADWHRQMVRYHALRANGAFNSAREVAGAAEVARQYAAQADALADMVDGLIDSTEWRETEVFVVAFSYDGGGGFEWDVTPAFLNTMEAKIRQDYGNLPEFSIWRTTEYVTDSSDRYRTTREIDGLIF